MREFPKNWDRDIYCDKSKVITVNSIQDNGVKRWFKKDHTKDYICAEKLWIKIGKQWECMYNKDAFHDAIIPICIDTYAGIYARKTYMHKTIEIFVSNPRDNSLVTIIQLKQKHEGDFKYGIRFYTLTGEKLEGKAPTVDYFRVEDKQQWSMIMKYLNMEHGDHHMELLRGDILDPHYTTERFYGDSDQMIWSEEIRSILLGQYVEQIVELYRQHGRKI